MILLILLGLADLLGRDYNAAVRHTPYDVERRAVSRTARQLFRETLTGPQAPAVLINRQGNDLIVWETCTEHLCGDSHSVVARMGDRLFAMVINDQGRTIVVPDPGIERLIGNACNGPQCDWGTPVAVGRPITPEPLRIKDLVGYSPHGGCSVFSHGALVMFIDKTAVIRFRGETRHLVSDGPARYVSIDNNPDLVVYLTGRDMSIMTDNEVVSLPVRKTCGVSK